MSQKTSGTTKSKVDTSKFEDVKEAPKASEVEIKAEDIKAVSKVDYLSLRKVLNEQGSLVIVTNDSGQPLIQDWNLDLLPEDIEEDFNKYLQEKYVQYELTQIVKGHRIVSVYINGTTVNFLDSYLSQRKYPVLLPRVVGKEQQLRPSFVLNAGASVIMTKKQAGALEKFEKVKKVWDAGGERKESPWLGFLKMKTITDEKDLFKCQMSYVTTKDVEKTHEDVKEGSKLYTRNQVGIIREEE